MKAIMAEFGAEHGERQEGAEPRRRQGRDDGERMGEALVEHAQHDIDRHQRAENQGFQTVEGESWKACALPLEAGDDGRRKLHDIGCNCTIVDDARRVSRVYDVAGLDSKDPSSP